MLCYSQCCLSVDDLLQIEEELPPRGFSFRECFSTCCGYLKVRCWPPLKRVLTFTIPHTSLFNTVLGLLSTLAAFVSVFTLTFQVSQHPHTAQIYVHLIIHIRTYIYIILLLYSWYLPTYTYVCMYWYLYLYVEHLSSRGPHILCHQLCI